MTHTFLKSLNHDHKLQTELSSGFSLKTQKKRKRGKEGGREREGKGRAEKRML